MRPRPGTGLVLFTVSRKTQPGSPDFHADLQMSLKMAAAVSSTSSTASTAPVGVREMRRGSDLTPSNEHIHGAGSCVFTASMNRSVRPTETLKLDSAPSLSLQWMNSRMSGCSTDMTAILAPCRFCCLITPNAALNTDRNDTGPDAEPCDATVGAPAGRRRWKGKPRPDPPCCSSAASRSVSKIDSIVSCACSTMQFDTTGVLAPTLASVPASRVSHPIGTATARHE